MAHALYADSTYKTGSGMTYPVVMHSPYPNWEQLCVRCLVLNATDISIGDLVAVADSGPDAQADLYTIVAADRGVGGTVPDSPYGVVVDTPANKRQLEIDNSGTAATKALTFAASSYVWVLPLIPGFILSLQCEPSIAVYPSNVMIISATAGMITIAGDTADAAFEHTVGRVVGNAVKSGTGNPYVAVCIR